MGTALAVPTCSHSKQTFLGSWNDSVPDATPWPQAAAARSSEGSSPDTPKPPTWPVPERRPSAARTPVGFSRRRTGVTSRGTGICGENGRTLLTTFRNFSSQLCQPHSRCAPAPSAACTRLPRLLQRRPGGGGSPRPAGAARTQRTYSHNGVSAGTATPRGASCAAPGARLRRAPRGSARWPGSPAPRPTGRSYTASRCPPLVAPRWATRSLGAPRSALVAAAARSHPSKTELPSLAPSRPPPRPGQVSFLLPSGPVILRGRSARRVAATPTASAAQRPGRLSPPLYPPGGGRG